MRLLLGLVTIALLVPTAAGHTGLSSARPADGATVRIAPERVALTFAQPLARPGEVTVTGPSGSELAGPPRQDPRDARRVIVELGADGAGAYRVRWSIIGADGHAVSGTSGFSAGRGSVARHTEAVRRSLATAGAALRRSS